MGERRVSASTEIALTHYAGDWVPQTGAALTFDAGPRVQIGGVGRFGLHHPTVHAPSALRLRFGYGGVRIALRPSLGALSGLRVALLAGAGNVDVQDPSVEGVVDSENGGVLEPALTYTHALARRLAVQAFASWRFAFEFETLAGVSSAELGGPAVGVGLTFGPF